MSAEKIYFGTLDADMQPCPINPDWIIEGSPITRAKILSRSADGMATSLIWECSAGKFNWYYTIDETVYLLEGSVLVRDDDGNEHRVSAGEHIYFPAGTHAVWHIENYVRKVAFCRNPPPKSLVMLRNFAKKILVATGLRPAPPASAFGG